MAAGVFTLGALRIASISREGVDGLYRRGLFGDTSCETSQKLLPPLSFDSLSPLNDRHGKHKNPIPL